MRRARRELTQSDPPDAVDVSRQAIIAIEAGRYDPSLDLAFRLAEYFDCSIEDVFEPPSTAEWFRLRYSFSIEIGLVGLCR